MFDLDGQKAIVTGATRGIGKAIAHSLLEAGATVCGVYATNRQAAENFRDECSDKNDRLHLYQCNIANVDEVAVFYQKIEEQFDSIDILINNAGIRRDTIMAMMSEEDWRLVLDVNLSGSFHMAKQAVLLMMKRKYGRIINITSPMAHLGSAGQTNYAASKAGQIGMMRSLAKETARKKITVNCVSPGFISTELLNDLTEEQISLYKKMVPMKRFGRPEEVAHAVLFLVSPQASYISGAVLEITGGI